MLFLLQKKLFKFYNTDFVYLNYSWTNYILLIFKFNEITILRNKILNSV
jgi:hypothetical protein